MNIKTDDTYFNSSQGQLPYRCESREVASYLRDGSIWIGHFTDDGGALNFGDDRHDAAHGLGDLLYSETLEAAYWRRAH